jgi:predicted metal-dependent phosphoesterase TrpH
MIPKSGDNLVPLTADLHIHSALSPCGGEDMTPKEVLDKLLHLGINIFSITDHNSGLNSAAFEKASKEKGLFFIPGIEVQSSEEVHLLGYFPEVESLDAFNDIVVRPSLIEGVKNDPDKFGHQRKVNSLGKLLMEVDDMLSMPLTLSLNELVDAIHEYEGIAVAAHLDRGFSVIAQLGFIPPDLKIDAVEVKEVGKIDKIKQDYLKDRELNILSSSDSHYLDNLGPPKMRFRFEDPNVKNCLDCIRGVGTGKVSIIGGRSPVANGRRGGSPSPPSQRSTKDWKSLYK